MNQRLANAVILAAIILIASCRGASAQSRVFVASEWAVLIGHAADIGSTQRCLGAGRCREVNPWLARYESPVTFTLAKSAVAVGQLWAMRKLHRSHPKLATVTNYAIAAGFTSLALRNVGVGVGGVESNPRPPR